MTDRPQFGGLPLGDLIGAPLVAACQANVGLANATLEFINSIGFGASPDGPAIGPGSTAQFQFTGTPRSDPLTVPTGPGIGVPGPDLPVLPFAPTPEEPKD